MSEAVISAAGGAAKRLAGAARPGAQERLAALLAPEMEATAALIAARMASEHAPRIPEVTAHLIGAGGKRLRPLLTLAAARLCGYGGPHHVALAATVEFIHTATLLHDDVVDASEQRRGRPTANLLWDNTSSVLVGDYLFARSFQLMVEPGNLRVLSILSGAAATIAEGEVLQLTAARDLGATEETYLRVVRGKTAALFAAACEVGGVIAGAPEAQVQALHDYGDALGIAFQISDDLLDYEGEARATGKDAGDDFREGKMTLPVIRALAVAEGDERLFWERTVGRGRVEEGDLARAQAILARRGALAATRAEALGWAARARGALAALPGGRDRGRAARPGRSGGRANRLRPHQQRRRTYPPARAREPARGRSAPARRRQPPARRPRAREPGGQHPRRPLQRRQRVLDRGGDPQGGGQQVVALPAQPDREPGRIPRRRHLFHRGVLAPLQRGEDGAGGRGRAGVDQHQVRRRQRRHGLQRLPDPPHPRRRAGEAHRHVGAEREHARIARLRRRQSPERSQKAQRRRRVRGAAPDPRLARQMLAEGEPRAQRPPAAQRGGRAQDEVPLPRRHPRGARPRHLEPQVCRRRRLQRIPDAREHHQAVQEVPPVAPPPGDVQREVDLRRREGRQRHPTAHMLG